MYRAKHYIPINRRMYTRGEIIPDGLPVETISRLINAGAIEEIALTPAEGTENENPPEITDDGQEEHITEETPEESETEEADEEAEAPEIDVMAGIVQGGEKEPEKRKTATKKQAGRRKSG